MLNIFTGTMARASAAKGAPSGGYDMGWVEKCAAKARELLRENSITTPPVPIYEMARNYVNDVLAVEFPSPHDNISGYIDFDRSMIVVNAEDSPVRQRFTIAHELGHLKLHDLQAPAMRSYSVVYRTPLSTVKEQIEKEADCFAANLLVPKEWLLPIRTMDQGRLASLFGVSKEVIGWRLKNL